MKSADKEGEQAHVLALRAVAFISAQDDRLARFMELTGIDGETFRRSVHDPAFLGAVLDHLLHDESLLFEFSSFAQIPAKMVQTVRRQLP